MNIVNLRVMRGPNYWSNYRHKVIVLKLDLEELEEQPTNLIDGFAERLKALVPSLYEHRCSEGHAGGFFERVEKGTWMGHVVEHLALELQSLAGIEVGYGRTRSNGKKGVYYVIYSYEVESAGIYAGEAAVEICDALAKNEPVDINAVISRIKQLCKRDGLGPSTLAIIQEAKSRRIPVRELGQGSLVMLGHGVNQRRIQASICCNTSCIAVDLVSDKERTKKLLGEAHIPVAPGMTVYDEQDLEEAIEEIGFPLVVKPVDGNHGRGITINIQSKEEALAAFYLAKQISTRVIVESFVQGSDYRFLVVNYKLVAVAKRTPAMVMGDGVSTIAQLVEKTNADPERGEGHEKTLTKIVVDESTETLLKSQGLTLENVLPLGEILFLKQTANLSTGGTARDVTDYVHPHNAFMAERIARITGLDICGIDIMARDVAIPITNETGAVLEVNAAPGLRMHLAPHKGLARNVAAPILDMLYPKGKAARIPIVAITGTNGKTTTTRLVAHIAKQAGKNVGYTTTDGIYVHDRLIHAGDCTGAVSAETVLAEPTVDFAVLECARGGILRNGLGFDQCDVSIVTNVMEDHIGLGDIETLEEMAKVKAVVPRSTAPNGYAILNADDDAVYDMSYEVDSNIALFSIYENNPRVLAHCEEGGLAAIIEKGYVTICRGQWKMRVEKVEHIPICFSGRATNMIKNVLPAVLAAVAQEIDLESIRAALTSFIPSPSTTPGRMNLFRFRDFELMIDYAHNGGSLMDMKHFMESTPASVRIGIITAVGDRRDEEIRNVGFCAAQVFDELIIRHDKDMRGRDPGQMTQLLIEGIRRAKPEMTVRVIPDELEAIRIAMQTAPKNAFIAVFTEDVWSSIGFVAEQQAKEKQSTADHSADPDQFQLRLAQ